MIIQGTAFWAKVVGPAQPGYDKTQKEWSIDVAISKEVKEQLVKEGLKAKIKNKGDDRGDFISFKRKEIRADGTPSKPIRIVDGEKRDWDQKVLIGNGSTVNVSFMVNDYTYNGAAGKKPGLIAIQVVKLVPYEGGDHEDFATYDETGTETWEVE